MARKILDYRENLTPYDYPEFAEMHYSVMHSPWSPFEVSMSSDVLDWHKITEEERQVIAGILAGFTLIETHVGCYWRDVVAKSFSLHEIVMLATAFSHQESVHARAYAHLDDTLGLDSYKAFKQNEVAVRKLEAFINPENSNLATSLALFSGGGEGVSLFASFAILLSFTKKGMFKGMQQILSWSTLDEACHSKVGIKLYKYLIGQYPDQKPDVDIIYKGFDAIVENEIHFVNQAFSLKDLDTITLNQAISFIKYRANLKLMELGLEPKYESGKDYLTVKDFFNTMVFGKTQNDFFALMRDGSGYSAVITQDFKKHLA